MGRIRFNKTITLTNENIKQIRSYLKYENELEKIKEWDFDNLIDALAIKNDFIAIILKHLIIEENAETIFNTK